MTDLTGSDLLKTLQTQSSANNKQTILLDPKKIERIPSETARNIRISTDKSDKANKSEKNDKTPKNEARNIRTEGRVTKHDRSDNARYSVQTRDGEIQMRATVAAQRPPLDAEVIVTIPKQALSVPPRSDATQTNLSEQASKNLPRASNPPQIKAYLTPITAQTTTEPAQPLADIHALNTVLPPTTQTSNPIQLAKSAIATSPFTASIAAPQSPLDNIINATTALITTQNKNALLLTTVQMQNDSAETSRLITTTKNTAALTNNPSVSENQIQTIKSAPINPFELTSPIFDFTQTHNKTKIILTNTYNAPPAILTDIKAGQISAHIEKMAEPNTTGKHILRINSFELPNTYTSPYTNFGMTASQNFLMQTSPATPSSSGINIALTPKQSAHTLQISLPQVADNMPALPLWGNLLFKTENWPIFNELQQALAQTAPQQAASFTQITPNTTNQAQMMPAMLFFMSAIKSGDLSSWLGEKTVELLNKAGKGKLLSKLNSELTSHSRLANEGTSEWRTHAFPMLHDTQFHKILFHVKTGGEEDNHDKNGKGKSARFIFDLQLNHIGDLQLDGFFHDNGQRLDLIVRTKQTFSKAMQTHMKQLYAGALEQSQIYGDITFQHRPEQWVSVTPSAQHQTTKNV